MDGHFLYYTLILSVVDIFSLIKNIYSLCTRVQLLVFFVCIQLTILDYFFLEMLSIFNKIKMQHCNKTTIFLF